MMLITIYYYKILIFILSKYLYFINIFSQIIQYIVIIVIMIYQITNKKLNFLNFKFSNQTYCNDLNKMRFQYILQ